MLHLKRYMKIGLQTYADSIAQGLAVILPSKTTLSTISIFKESLIYLLADSVALRSYFRYAQADLEQHCQHMSKDHYLCVPYICP